MKTYLLFAFMLISCFFKVEAQSLEATVNKLKSIDKASFTEIVKFKFSFQDEFSVDTFKTHVAFIPAEKQIGGHYSIRGKSDSYLFDGTKAVWLNLRDTTYKITTNAVGGQHTRTILYWEKEITKYLNSPSKIRRQPDTIINKAPYNHYLVTLTDTIQNNKRVYDFADIITAKTNGLPYIIRTDFKGFADDGAYMGMFEEHTFKDYKFKKADFPDLSTAIVPQGFKLPVKKAPVPMLTEGTISPNIKLTDLAGKDFTLASLRGKLVLLNFTTDGCPHCINAAQMLTRLYDEYKSKDLEIISIYQTNFNSIKSVTKFDAKNGIKYPSYLTDASAANVYHINGYPNFYLLNKQGVIVQAYEGFYAELESQIIEKMKTIK
ncbi:peroxiredoxin family protein [Mucilaginibacter lacusdianchii]|uniref:peroxiredoxin family protein n=1 Tax=Mucilaginibacter lacusdianchii TaxID=2684211 RepID=UPI00131A955C|nr:TlpA disulfide reductase family protein [Mucilaginibacter sp. JXJ CY 39]